MSAVSYSQDYNTYLYLKSVLIYDEMSFKLKNLPSQGNVTT